MLTMKVTEFEEPPPGGGLVTTTGKFPAVAWSAALSAIVSWVALTNVAVWAAPLYVTVELAKKFEPLTVSV